MFISCFLMRSRSRSSGPSYSGILILYGVAISVLRVCGGASAGNLFALFVPAENGFAHPSHRLLRDVARLLRTLVDHFEDALRILLILHAPLADGRNPLDQIV